MNRTPGQRAYEASCMDRPTYPDGIPRKPWGRLGEPEKRSWERNPTWPPQNDKESDT